MVIKQSVNDRLFQAFSYVFISLFALFCVVPFWMMIVGSITDETELILSGYALWPGQISFQSYDLLFSSGTIFRSYGVTILVTTIGTIIAVIISALLGYAIANKRNRLRNPLAFYVYFTMLFNGGLVPFYILIHKWLQLSDTLWAMVFPVVMQPFLVFLLVNFFRTLPDELEEAARIDGANEVRIFFGIVLPISVPIVATVALFFALSYWNDWFNALLFINREELYPLQILLRRLISNMQAAQNLLPASVSQFVNVPSLGMRMATTVVAIGPIIFLYPFVQRYFVSGLTIGAVKG
ncbi:carbohydrate ABC transporter permease [Paenibacillus sp. 1P07SE]|uniref:carbohydrate ABC transporter permease n=1 Tax=Paenibacillus sp. 1P07SE TaxID=3132209 RepID=UPI0039A448C2